MKTTVASEVVGTYSDGSPQVLPLHEIEVLCAACRDPVSSQEESTGVCTACNQPWEAAQSVAVHVTSTPLSGIVKV